MEHARTHPPQTHLEAESAILVLTGGRGREEQGGEIPPCMQGGRPLYGRSDVRALVEQTPVANGLESTLQ
eukprot:302785-Pleurochrysis_carterae.AAC.1